MLTSSNERSWTWVIKGTLVIWLIAMLVLAASSIFRGRSRSRSSAQSSSEPEK